MSHRPDFYTVRLVVDSPTAETAIAEGTSIVTKVAEGLGFPAWPIVHAEATEWSRFEDELEQPTYPRVVGLAEVAAMLDISKQRATAVTRSSAFPKPYAELAAGPVWFEPMIKRFADNWTRRPGRPRKETV